MVKKKLLEQIKNDFTKIIKSKDVLGILLYGSHILNKGTNRSDIDLCIVAPNENPYELLSYIRQKININFKKYDVRIFKELPIYIKIQVIEEGIVTYSPNKLDLFEYFYFYRKIWADQKHRQELTKEELLHLME